MSFNIQPVNLEPSMCYKLLLFTLLSSPAPLSPIPHIPHFQLATSSRICLLKSPSNSYFKKLKTCVSLLITVGMHSRVLGSVPG